MEGQINVPFVLINLFKTNWKPALSNECLILVGVLVDVPSFLAARSTQS